MFWDSSAVVPVLVAEGRSAAMAALLRSDKTPAIWWGSPVECQSALHRRRRGAVLSAGGLAEALARLVRLAEDVDVVAPTARLRERAGRALAAHPLRAADALQLAADRAETDSSERLRDAAHREGFEVLPDRL